MIIYGLQEWAGTSANALEGGFALVGGVVGTAARMFGGIAVYSFLMGRGYSSQWRVRCFDTELTRALRMISASAFFVGCGYAAHRFVLRDERLLPIVSLVAGSVVAILYAWLIRRKGWFTVSAVQMLVLAGLMSYDGYSTGKLRRINWPISGGIACFVVGVVITSSKTSQFAQACERRKTENSETVSVYLPGI